MKPKWETFEQVATAILEKLSKEFGLSKVEGKQRLVGIETGTEWEVDAKGICEDGEGIVIIECKDCKSKQNQEKMAGLAYRIQDTGARRGIVVSRLGLQRGARKVAQANNILSIEIDANSTPENFALRFLNKLFYGVTISSSIRMSGELTIARNCSECGKLFTVKRDEKICEECNSLKSINCD